METRQFGRMGHQSSLAIFGGAAFWNVTQEAADAAMAAVIAAGVNHIDVAPSYGDAEERLGPWMARERQRFFLNCKTTERTRAGASAELRRSLHRLQVSSFDLYQIHAITRMEELDQALGSGGTIEAIEEAREQGLLRYIGITGHGSQTPAIFREALRRYDFDSVMFPINSIQYANPEYRRESEALLAECRSRNVAVMAIKSIARAPWGDRPPTHTTWYEPFTEPEQIDTAVRFTLSQDITAICTAGDLQVLPRVLAACQNFRPMPLEEQEQLIATARQYETIFP
jgi:aryl-alcohol dehydrogenase-like predicted oxidoreductase